MTKFVKVKPELCEAITERWKLGDAPEVIAQSFGLPLQYVQRFCKNKERQREKSRAKKRVGVTKRSIQAALRAAVNFPQKYRDKKDVQAYLAVEGVVISQIKAGGLTLVQSQQHLAGLFRGIFDNYANNQPRKRSASVEDGAKAGRVSNEARDGFV